MPELPHTHSCFVCGEKNPLGLNLRFHDEGENIVSATFTPRREHIGFQNVTHGGVLATVLDEIMVWACAVATRRFAYCAEMTTRFHQPAPPGEELTVTSELTTNRRNRIFEAKAEIRTANQDLVAEGTGKYLPIKTDQIPAMLQDVVGDISWIEGVA
ncbi:MAG: PaaI family thioesterase [Limisphaerales bacterium]